jgi:hypothetical protein
MEESDFDLGAFGDRRLDKRGRRFLDAWSRVSVVAFEG